MFEEPKSDIVKDKGAKVGDILVGIKPSNRDLRVRVHQSQNADRKQIRGSFDLISAGTGQYAAAMSGLEGTTFQTAKDLIEIVRGKSGNEKCTYILHGDMLRVDKLTKSSADMKTETAEKADALGVRTVSVSDLPRVDTDTMTRAVIRKNEPTPVFEESEVRSGRDSKKGGARVIGKSNEPDDLLWKAFTATFIIGAVVAAAIVLAELLHKMNFW